MGIFGFKRAECVTCKHSLGDLEMMLLCTKRQVLVARNDQCKLYEREPGVEGE
jgi:hypothetical protein